MLILIIRNMTNNNMYITQELHTFLHSFYLKVNFFHILQLIYHLTYFYIGSFYNLNILQHHMIYHIHIQNCLDFK